jgi:hypothetical protein
MGKLVNAEKFLAERLAWAENSVNSCINAKPHGDWYTPERIAAELAEAKQKLALWQAARIAEVKLVEA